MSTKIKPWEKDFSKFQLNQLKALVNAPSPVGYEGAMALVIEKQLKKIPQSWEFAKFKSNASLVIDTNPGQDDMTSVMFVGHMDKIRLQVRNIGKDGKVWVETDSFLPISLIGAPVVVIGSSSNGSHSLIRGGSVQAFGAAHFAEPSVFSGEKGLKKKQVYLEFGAFGEEDAKSQIEKLGIRVGDVAFLDNPLTSGVIPGIYTGGGLDNALGCFVVAQLAARIAKIQADEEKPGNLRFLFAFVSHEEIGRFGSSIAVAKYQPDLLIAIDVNHDYVNAPGIDDRKMPILETGKGFTIGHGSMTSFWLNNQLESVADSLGIPHQRDVVGRDTGTDAMAAPLTGTDSAIATVGFPLRYMHTGNEMILGSDVLTSLYALLGLIKHFEAMNDGKGLSKDDLYNSHIQIGD